MKSTFAAVACPVIPAPCGTDAARAAVLAYRMESQEPLFPVHGGFLDHDRRRNYRVVSESGETRELGIGYKNIPGYGMGIASVISPDRARILIVEDGDLEVLTLENDARVSLGVSAVSAAWLDDDRIVLSDGKTLAVRRVSSGEVLGERAFGKAEQLSARADGVIVVPYGDVFKLKTRSIEVYRLEGSEIVAIGKKAKVPFTIIVPFEGELYLVERAHFGNWVACFKLEVKEEADAKKTKTKADAKEGGGSQEKPWAKRRVAAISIGKKRDDEKLEAALATFPPKVRSKYKLDQVLDCTTDERGKTGFTIDAGGESKVPAASILEILALPEVKALPHLSLALDGKGALAVTLAKALVTDTGKLATVTGLDVSGAPKGQALAKELLASSMAHSLERLAMREVVLWEFAFDGLDSLEALDLEENHFGKLPANLPSLRRLRLSNALYKEMVESLATSAWVPQLVELRLVAKQNHYSLFPAGALETLAGRGLSELRELGLAGQSEAGDAVASAFAASSPKLETALLARTAVGSVGAAALIKGCPSLTNLDVAGNAEAVKGLGAGGASLERLRVTADDDAAEVLGKNADLGAVRRLLLILGELGPNGIRAMVGSPLFAGLTELTIDGIASGSWEKPSEPDHVGDEGAVLIAEAPALANLTYLYLRSGSVGEKGATALANSKTLGKLETIDLDWNPIGPDTIIKLIEQLPSLKKLTYQLRDKGALEKVRNAAFRRGIELLLFHGLYKL